MSDDDITEFCAQVEDRARTMVQALGIECEIDVTDDEDDWLKIKAGIHVGIASTLEHLIERNLIRGI